MEKPTPIEIIGQVLAHDSLKLSQKEHLIIIESYNNVRKTIDDLIKENEILKTRINDLELEKTNK